MSQEAEIIREALEIANKKGCYGMDESAKIIHCFSVLAKAAAESKQLAEALERAESKLKQIEVNEMVVVAEETKPDEKGPAHKQNDVPAKKLNHKGA